MPYQTFGNVVGSSDSAKKLECLRLPISLQGMSVLDIGCNEGCFCQEAKRRGARRVVGIDKNKDFIAAARSRDGGIDFRVMDWVTLRELKERFNLVLFLSSLHYTEEPHSLLSSIFDVLASSGLLILECGVIRGKSDPWTKVERPVGDVRLFPSMDYLLNVLLSDYATRFIGRSVDQKGDRIPRYVFHCRPFRRIAILLSGPSRIGKTVTARELEKQNVQVFSVDALIVDMSWCTNKDIIKVRNDNFNHKQIQHFIGRIVKTNLGSQFGTAIAEHVRKCSLGRLFFIEGYALSVPVIRQAVSTIFERAGYVVWRMTR